MSNKWQSFYSTEAAVYDTRRYRTWYGRLFSTLHRQALAQALPEDLTGGAILEIASGTGHNLPVLASRAKLVASSDLTPAMLQIARQKTASTGNVVYVINDALRLPYANARFDAVVSSRFLHLFSPSQQRTLIAEMSRTLKPGKYLIIDFYNQRHWQFLSPIIRPYRWLTGKRPTQDTYNQIESVRFMLQELGFQIIQTIGVGSYLLALGRLLPRRAAVAAGRSFQRPPLRLLAEQFLVCAQKQK